MRVMILGAAIAMVVGTVAWAQGSHAVRGYTRSDGTYVAPHMQTNPNQTRNDNYSTRGNVNPYTGQAGTKPRDEDVYGQRQAPSTAWEAPRHQQAPAWGRDYTYAPPAQEQQADDQ